MTVDLQMLVYSSLFCFVLVLINILGGMTTIGLPPLLGDRAGFPELPGWAGRSSRTHRNMLENLVPFAAIVLTAHIADKIDATAILGTQIFFYARIVHAICYIGAINLLRPLAWGAGVFGTILVALPLI